MTKPEIRKPATTSFQIIDHSLRYWLPSRYQPLQEKTMSRTFPFPARRCSYDSMHPREQKRRVRPSSVSVNRSLPSVPQTGSVSIRFASSESRSARRARSKRSPGRVKRTRTAMIPIRTRPPRISANRNSHPNRMRIIRPSSTIRLVLANMKARTFTAWAPFLKIPFPIAVAPKLQPLLAAPNPVALSRAGMSGFPRSFAIRSLET